MKILMTLMGLEIGGAETHVVELSKELRARGYDIVVASSGGVYERELEKSGIRHVTLPLHTKSPSALIKSYKGLERLISREKFDIVHAHARIPAFVCGLLAKKMGFHFITSTHGVYKVDPILTRVSDWGERSIAVSPDVKQYLIDKYRMPSDNIDLTINGIDTKHFSKNIDSNAVKRELGLIGHFRVVCVSRIDTEAAMHAFLLCDAAEALYKEIPGFELLIVGGGTAFEALKTRADELNRKAGRALVKLTGARTDVAELIGSADVFVGVSRSALEAMSEEKPVVLAGAQGYIGILTRENEKLAESTNFCCRGEKLPTAGLLADDLRRLHAMTPEERADLGRYNRSVILRGYSVSKMADDYVRAYKKVAFPKYDHGDIVISGYYGFDNMGDDSLLMSIVDGIRSVDPDIGITVLSNKPSETRKLYGVRSVNRVDIPRIAAEMNRAKLLISGGGSLLQDGTSRKSLFYYVTIMRMAKKRGLSLMLLANGLGPLVSESGKRCAAEIMREADRISLREEHSMGIARELGIPDDPKRGPFVSADPAFLMKPTDPLWTDHILAREDIGRDFFLVSIKPGNNFGSGKSAKGERPPIETIAADIKKISGKYNLLPVLVPMHPDKDTDITRELAGLIGECRVVRGLSASELCGLLTRASFAVGMRLHMLIFAAAAKTPMIGISYDPKIDAFLDYIGQKKFCLDVRNVAEGELLSAADAVMADREGIAEALRTVSDRMRRLAASDCEAAVREVKKDCNLL